MFFLLSALGGAGLAAFILRYTLFLPRWQHVKQIEKMMRNYCLHMAVEAFLPIVLPEDATPEETVDLRKHLRLLLKDAMQEPHYRQ